MRGAYVVIVVVAEQTNKQRTIMSSPTLVEAAAATATDSDDNMPPTSPLAGREEHMRRLRLINHFVAAPTRDPQERLYLVNLVASGPVESLWTAYAILLRRADLWSPQRVAWSRTGISVTSFPFMALKHAPPCTSHLTVRFSYERPQIEHAVRLVLEQYSDVLEVEVTSSDDSVVDLTAN